METARMIWKNTGVNLATIPFWPYFVNDDAND